MISASLLQRNDCPRRIQSWFLPALIGFGLFVTVFSPVAAQEVVDSVCAIVDDDIILESDVAYGINSLLLENGVRYPTHDQLELFRRQVLDAYITQKILLAQAVEETLQVEERAVDRELERKLQSLVQQVGSEQKLVDYFGRPLRQIKREMRQGVRDGLLIDKLKMQRLGTLYVRRDEVRDFYKQHADSLPALTERVALSHILLSVAPSQEADDRARAATDSVLTLLRAGADFDSIARIYSEDPATAANGGRVGFTERNDLVPEYEEVAYALEPGEISGVVASRFGFHIIRLIERQGERISTQHILKKLEPTANDWQNARNIAAALRDSILAGGDFGRIAREYSADSSSAAHDGKLGFLELATLPVEFQDACVGLQPGELSEPFESAYGIHIIRVDDRQSARKISPETDWQSLEQLTLSDKREKLFQDWVASLRSEHYIWTGN
jgi:peptidyl-prolyl cis-trans isomerase SurA